MATITPLQTTDTGADSMDIINTNVTNLNNDKLEKSGGTLTGQISFSGTTHAGVELNSLTTTQRDALTPANGMIIYNSTTGQVEKYESGAWVGATGVANATNAVEGIVELATQSEIDNDTAIGGTGAALAVTPDQLVLSKYGTRLPSSDEKLALAGTSGTPSSTNKYVTNDDTAENTPSKLVRRKSDGTIDSVYFSLAGDGSDGDVVISSNTTLTRDMYYNTLTVNNGYTLNPSGYRIFVKETLTNNGTISRNGNNGTSGGNGGNADGTNTPAAAGIAGTSGAALSAGTLPGSPAEPAPSAGGIGKVRETNGATNGTAPSAGGNGNNVTTGIIGLTAQAGASSPTSGGGVTPSGTATGATGTGGTAGTITNAKNPPRNIIDALHFYEYFIADSLTLFYNGSPSNGAAAGGASGGVSKNSENGRVNSGGGGGGGGNGSNGGIVVIAAKSIINNGTISANGGNGGNGGNAGTTYNGASGSPANGAAGGSSGGGGGNGGNGGIVVIACIVFSGNTPSVSGGTGGTGGTKSVGVLVGSTSVTDGSNGADGSNGDAGLLLSIES